MPNCLRLMRAANFQAVFIGIESPDPETLMSAQKRQNTKRSLTESIHRVYDAGIYVVAGFIIGFDTEKDRVADAMITAIEAMSIPVAMVGLLFALQDTQLSRRLRKEGRMLPVEANKGDQCTGGLNFITLRPKREILADYRAVLKHVFAPENYFGRVRTMGRALKPPEHAGKRSLVEVRREFGAVCRLAWCMTFTRPALRRHFWKTVLRLRRPQPRQPRRGADDDGLLSAPRRVLPARPQGSGRRIETLDLKLPRDHFRKRSLRRPAESCSLHLRWRA